MSAETYAQLRRAAGRTFVPSGLRYGLFRRLGSLERPLAFPDAAGLARALQRARCGRAIELVEVDLPVRGDDGEAAVRPAVSVWTLDADGERCDFIGTALLGRGDRRALQAALRAADPELVGEDA